MCDFDFEDPDDYIFNEDQIIEIDDWDESECHLVQTTDANSESSKIISVLSHNLTSLEELFIHKEFNNDDSKKNSVTYTILVIIKTLSSKGILLSNLTLCKFFDTLTLKIKKIENKNNKKKHSSSKCIEYINSWLIIIRSYLINGANINKLQNQKSFDYNLDLAVQNYMEDIWCEKLKFLKDIIETLFYNLFLVNNKLYYKNCNSKEVVKSNLNTSNQVDFVMIQIMILLYHYGIYKHSNYDNIKLLNIPMNDYNFLINHISKLETYFERKKKIELLKEYTHKPYYNDIIYLILSSINNKMYKLEIIKIILQEI